MGANGKRIGLELVDVVDVGMGKGMVRRDRVAGLGHPVEHREVDDPQKAETLADRRLAELQPERSKHGSDRVEVTRLEEQQVARLRAGCDENRSHLVSRHELGDRSLDLGRIANGLDLEPGQALGAESFDELGELIDAVAGQL